VNFLIAIVLTAVLCGMIVALPPFYPQVLRYPNVAVNVFFIGSLFSLPIVAVGGLLIGMPIAFALKAQGVTGSPKWGVAGATAGAVYSLLIALAADGLPPSSLDALAMAWLGIVPGSVAGLYWWRAVGRHELSESAAF
jgi:hypothetical protein